MPSPSSAQAKFVLLAFTSPPRLESRCVRPHASQRYGRHPVSRWSGALPGTGLTTRAGSHRGDGSPDEYRKISQIARYCAIRVSKMVTSRDHRNTGPLPTFPRSASGDRTPAPSLRADSDHEQGTEPDGGRDQAEHRPGAEQVEQGKEHQRHEDRNEAADPPGQGCA